MEYKDVKCKKCGSKDIYAIADANISDIYIENGQVLLGEADEICNVYYFCDRCGEIDEDDIIEK